MSLPVGDTEPMPVSCATSSTTGDPISTGAPRSSASTVSRCTSPRSMGCGCTSCTYGARAAAGAAATGPRLARSLSGVPATAAVLGRPGGPRRRGRGLVQRCRAVAARVRLELRAARARRHRRDSPAVGAAHGRRARPFPVRRPRDRHRCVRHQPPRSRTVLAAPGCPRHAPAGAGHRPRPATDRGRTAILRERALVHETSQAYAHVQRTTPVTLGYALSDSPIGLAAWIVEKWRAWSDCGGEVEARFSKDQLLTNVCLYWFSRSVLSSLHSYADLSLATASISAGDVVHTDAPPGADAVPLPAGQLIDVPMPCCAVRDTTHHAAGRNARSVTCANGARRHEAATSSPARNPHYWPKTSAPSSCHCVPDEPPSGEADSRRTTTSGRGSQTNRCR
jgi:hypothetical protein